MYTKHDKEWFNYCKALNLNPYDKAIKESDYYQRGFEEWKKLSKDYLYYRSHYFCVKPV